MKTVKEVRLYFKNEKSDKVYEVDLCQVEDDLFTVIFRYGKRNSTLKEGTKTIFPVPFEEASSIFDKLVLSKTKKGYLHVGEAPPVIEPSAKPIETLNSQDSIKGKTILRHLKDLEKGSIESDWPTSRILWRAGELKLTKAGPFLVPYLSSSDFMEQYAALWSVGRCGKGEVADEIYTLWKETKDSRIKRLAAKYLVSFDSSHQSAVVSDIKSRLPSLLLSAIESSSKKEIYAGIQDFTEPANKETPHLFIKLYLISGFHPSLRQALLEKVRHLPAKVNSFKALRAIYKLAEFGDDFEFLAACAKTMGLSLANYCSAAYGVWHEGELINIEENQALENTVLAFSDRTKNYFTRRTLRKIKRLGNDFPSDYINLAVEILLSVDDEIDKGQPFRTYSYDYSNGWELIHNWHPKYHTFTAYNQILFGESERMNTTRSHLFSFAEGITPSDEPVTSREEYLSSLWDSDSKPIIRILSEAKTTEVNEFALKIFQSNRHFKNQLTDQELISIIQSRYETTVDTFTAIIKGKYLLESPPFELIMALLKTDMDKSFNLGKDFLASYLGKNKIGSQNFAALISTGQLRVTELILAQAKEFSNLEPLVYSQIASIINQHEFYTDEYIYSLIEITKNEYLSQAFSELNSHDLELFISSERTCIVELGIALMKVNKRPTYELAADHIEAILDSEDSGIRAAGIELLLDFPEAFLEEKQALLISFVFSPHAEIREKIIPIISKLVQKNEPLRIELFNALVSAISQKETVDGIHASHLKLLNESFSNELNSIDKKVLTSFLLSDVDASQKLGEQLFTDLNFPAKLELNDWVELKDSDVFAVRKELINYFKNNVSEVMNNLSDALLVVESKWADLRAEMLTYFLEHSSPENWTLDLVLQVIDSPNEDSQSFGRSVITRVFSSDHGKQLMIHLSEHPSRSMMLFNSNYLNLHAKGDEDVVLKLKLYFKSILYSVNEGSVSKARVFAFLKQELKYSKKVAQMTLDILEDVLQTQAIGDKSKSIDLALEIHSFHPELTIPLTIKPLKTFSHAV